MGSAFATIFWRFMSITFTQGNRAWDLTRSEGSCSFREDGVLGGDRPSGAVPRMDIFLAALDDIPDLRADDARRDLCERLVASFVAGLCAATGCAGTADLIRAKEHVFRDFLKLRHSAPSQDAFPTVFRMIDPKALDAAFGRVLAQIAVLPGEGDVIAIDGKALRGARQGAKRADQEDGPGLRRASSPPRPRPRPARHLQGVALNQTQARRVERRVSSQPSQSRGQNVPQARLPGTFAYTSCGNRQFFRLLPFTVTVPRPETGD
ncbi:MAG: transposase family protein [Rhodobacter sp.]|jgi:hypothetical protein|nr:transposase family protein [Rhodobacter sp.]